MSPLLKNLTIALVITVLAGLVYFMFIKSDPADEIEPVSGEKHEVALKTEKILSDIQEIKKYEIDNTLFEDPRFLSLKDIRVKIPDVDTGRKNPFEPVQ